MRGPISTEEYRSIESKSYSLIEKFSSKKLLHLIRESKQEITHSTYRATLPDFQEIDLFSGTQLWIASLIDHTLLKPNASSTDIELLCAEAREYKFATVCVHPVYLSTCKKKLAHANTKVITVIGFPLGCSTTAVKAFETQDAIHAGAEEIDMVINVGALRSNYYDDVWNDIHSVVQAASPFLVKVIIESASLTDEEKIIASWICRAAGAQFVKTSTGFSASGGASVRDIELIRKAIGDNLGIKASGGIGNTTDAIAMIQAGADRIGSSASKDIILGKYV